MGVCHEALMNELRTQGRGLRLNRCGPDLLRLACGSAAWAPAPFGICYGDASAGRSARQSAPEIWSRVRNRPRPKVSHIGQHSHFQPLHDVRHTGRHNQTQARELPLCESFRQSMLQGELSAIASDGEVDHGRA